MEKIKELGKWTLWLNATADGGSFEIWKRYETPYAYSFVHHEGKFTFKLRPKRKWLVKSEVGVHEACSKAMTRLIELDEADKATVEAIALAKELALEAVGEIE